MANIRVALVSLAAAVLAITASHAALAEYYPTAPRTPMGPGTGIYDRDFAPESRTLMLPDSATRAMRGGELTYKQPAQPPDLASLETRAISDLSEGKSDVVVSSRADTTLILQLYRPDQGAWQEYRLAPLSNTAIACPDCSGKFTFAFNNGIEQSEIVLETPSLLRIYPSPSGDRWGWDILKLQAASTTSGQP